MVKTHPEILTAGTILNINATHTNDSREFDEAFRIFHNLLSHYTDYGMLVYFELSLGRLHIAPFVGPRLGKDKVREKLKPIFDQLDATKNPHDTYIKAFLTFFELRVDMFEDGETNRNSAVSGRRFTMKNIAGRGTEVADAIPSASAPTTEDIGLSASHIVNPGYVALVMGHPP